MNYFVVIIGGGFALLGTVMGAVLSHLLSSWHYKKTERDEWDKSNFDRFEDIVFEVNKLSINYWTTMTSKKRTNSKIIEAAIMGKLKFVGLFAEDIFNDSKISQYHSISKELVDFHVACSHELYVKEAKLPDPDRCRDIEDATSALLYKAFLLQRKIREL